MIFRIDGDKMKKMNNKGFAVSSLLYGLLLVGFLVIVVLMSIMATNRHNTTNLIDKIEEELNRHSNTVTEFAYKAEAQEFIVPYGKTGWYKIELWGAAGAGTFGLPGSADNNIDKNQNRGSYTSGIVYLSENEHLYFYIGQKGTTSGGTPTFNLLNTSNTSGGGASDVRKVSGGGNADDIASRNSIIMLAAGGSNTTTENCNEGGGHYQNSIYCRYGTGGSFISGFGGQSKVYSKSFLGGMIFNGVNAGDGKARIELISQNGADTPPAKKSDTLENVTKIFDNITLNVSSLNGGKELWSEIQALDKNGNNVIRNATISSHSGTSHETMLNNLTNGDLASFDKITSISNGTNRLFQIRIELDDSYDLEELNIFHNFEEGTELVKEEIYINNVKKSTYSETFKDNIYLGSKISDRHLGNLSKLPVGNYYIVSAFDEGRVVSKTNNKATLKFFDGQKSQKWTISTVGTNIYKIIEAEDNYALSVTPGAGMPASVSGEYTGMSNSQWKIDASSGNEYYRIKYVPDENYCLTAYYPYENYELNLETCADTPRQYFKFMNADY